VVVAELVETSRLWGRTAAKIDPRWIEPLAEHLLKRTYEEPHWERKRAAVVATERATLYGLPVVAGRKVAYGTIDPELSRSLFIRRALVEGDWDTRHAFFAANRALLEEVEELEARARRRDILVDDQALYDFYDARVPADVVSGAHFDRWWRDERRRDPDRLTFTREDLVREGGDALDRRALPEAWRQGDMTMRLSYVFDPGAERDGVTVHVPLKWLPQLRPVGFDWLVPALRPELVTALIRSLPKDLRRPLVPVPEVAAAALARMTPRSEPLLDALARELEALRGVRIPPEAWALDRLPPHLRMTFRVEDERGALVAEGPDLDALREQVRPRLRQELASAAAPLEHHGLTSWTIGTLPKAVALPGTGQAVRGHPALVDEGATVGVRVLETPEAQREAMQLGTRKLLALNVPSPIRYVQGTLRNTDQLALATAPHGSPRAVLEDATVAALEGLMADAGGPAWDEAGFARLRDHVAGELAETTARAVRQVVAILDAARDVERRLEPIARAPALAPVREDVERQLRRLVHPGFVTATGVRRLPDVERYLRAAARRLERLPSAPAPDLDRMRGIHELEREYEARVGSWPAGRPVPAALREVPWLLEELRVSHFAQSLGTRGQASAKRIRKVIRDA
jgi:ATP-dependent helicase HrpA